jgi:hypothetical protein
MVFQNNVCRWQIWWKQFLEQEEKLSQIFVAKQCRQKHNATFKIRSDEIRSFKTIFCNLETVFVNYRFFRVQSNQRKSDYKAPKFLNLRLLTSEALEKKARNSTNHEMHRNLRTSKFVFGIEREFHSKKGIAHLSSFMPLNRICFWQSPTFIMKLWNPHEPSKSNQTSFYLLQNSWASCLARTKQHDQQKSLQPCTSLNSFSDWIYPHVCSSDRLYFFKLFFNSHI